MKKLISAAVIVLVITALPQSPAFPSHYNGGQWSSFDGGGPMPTSPKG